MKKNNTVLITGGTKGIGLKIAKELLIAGMQIIVISKLKYLNKKLNNIFSDKYSSQLKFYSCDVTNYPKLEKIFNEIGTLKAIINCAGILGEVEKFSNSDLNLWKKAIEVNLMGTVNCCKLALPILSMNPHSKIINISGGGAANSRIYHSSYAVSKTAVVRFTEILADECMDLKIDINVLAPGAHKTDIWNNETFDKPPKNWADTGRLLDTVKFLLSDRSNGISGRFIHINDNWEDLPNKKLSTDYFKLRRNINNES